jgi:hypothetical protein
MRNHRKTSPKPIFFLGFAEKENKINPKGCAFRIPLSIMKRNTFDCENDPLKNTYKKGY